MTRRLGGIRGRRRAALAIVVAVALAVPVIAFAQADAGGGISCAGLSKLDRSKPKSQHALIYRFRCSGTIRSFSIVSTKEVDEFDTAVPPDSEDFKCQGTIPGDGFSCAGDKGATIAAGHRVSGGFATSSKPCSRRGKGPRLWVVAVGEDAASTEPLGLRGPRCPKPKRRH